MIEQAFAKRDVYLQPMKFERKLINKSDIDIENKKYQIIDSCLSNKIDDILFTPILFFQNNKFIILSNFSFIDFKKNNVWANVLDESTSFLDCVKISILAQIKEKGSFLNLLEEAKALKLIESSIENRNLTKFAEEILGKEYNTKIIKNIINVNFFSEKIKEAIKVDLITFKVAFLLNGLSKEDLNITLTFFKNLKLSFSNQKKFLNLTKEIAKIKECSIFNVLKPMESIFITDLSPKNKTEKIEKALLEIRYPEITKAKKQLKEKIKSLKLPRYLKLITPENFEGLDFEVSFKFKNRDEFIERAEGLKKISGLGSLIE